MNMMPSQIFTDALKEWNKKESASKTYGNMKVYMHVWFTLISKLSKFLFPIDSAASTITKMNNVCDAITVKLDSGATRHYFKDEHKHLLSDLKHLKNGPLAQLPDNSFVKATYEGFLNLHPSLSNAAKKVLVYPQVT